MDARRYKKSVTLLCPSCGSSEFSSPAQSNDNAPVSCNKCGQQTTRAQLIRANQAKIDAEVKKVGKTVVDDVKRELQKSLSNAFKGNKHIKFKI